MNTQDILANTTLNLCETLALLIEVLIGKGVVDKEAAQELLNNLYKDRTEQKLPLRLVSCNNNAPSTKE